MSNGGGGGVGKERTNKPEYTMGRLVGQTIKTALLVGFALGTLEYLTANIIPKPSKVKEGFVNPSNIEIKMRDADLDGKKEETIFFHKNEQNQKIPYFLELKEETIYNNGSLTPTTITRPHLTPFEISKKRY